MKTTTIAITNETKEKLDKLKVHPNQSYDEVITNILEKKEGDRNGVREM